MKKVILLLNIFFIAIIATSQTWTSEFIVDFAGDLIGIEETESGNLEVHYSINSNEHFKLILSPEGDSIGLENYIPVQLENYFELQLDESLIFYDSISYLDTFGNLIWESALPFVGASETHLDYNEHFGFVKKNVFTGTQGQGTPCREEYIWIFNKSGNLIYENFINKNCVNEFQIVKGNSNQFILRKYSQSAALPQGAGGWMDTYEIIDSIGNVLCSENSIYGYSIGGEYITGIALNGVGNCGNIKRYLFFDELPDYQVIPCSNFELPWEFAIPDNKGMIGLENDGFVILGYDYPKTIVTRIDCTQPYEELCLYNFEVYINEELCFGENIMIGEESFSETGEYQIYLLDYYGCDSLVNLDLQVDDFEITIDPMVEVLNGLGEIDLNTNCDDCTFSWSNGEDSSFINNLETGIYNVTITTNNGCTADFEIEVSILDNTTAYDLERSYFFKNLIVQGECVEIKLVNHSELDRISVFSSNGILISSKKIYGLNDLFFNAPMQSGVYFLKLEGNRGIDVQLDKFIVK